MIRVSVQAEPFDAAAEIAALSGVGAAVGGLGCFIGLVRADDRPGEPPLAALVLEHYPGMSESMLREVAEQACARFPLLGCTVIHRFGRLPLGEPIVLVLAASRHRQAALDATGFLIDWLKTGAPFWKREERTDGSSRWVEARPADDHAAARWKD
ncbi:molybdenum cofactor biosynthesis protein MoaE [Rhizosaccharibacter radicis]|uniref:Molybdopterin synthase catalytic subunit n=1 Tax=Rhizosaccharibacter radicis TaxID=2782605 RepID=A0ABT1VV41_9PROT|nr:molybdenum cofactor biosynthesis protein MoaE [Acetobacteraceae bacterium KSS12]